MTAPVATPVPSAAVVLVREASPTFEVLLVRRNAELAFHGGAWVFPGGRIDPEEFAAYPEEPEAALHCAVRELREETALEITAGELLALSCWTTPEELPKRFRAWFFLAEARNPGEVRVDGGEIHAHQWTTPSAALAQQGRGELDLPPPVFTTLSLLSACADLKGALALAGAGVAHYEPRMLITPEGRVVLYPGDAGYPTRSLDVPGARDRLWTLPSGYRYERSAG